MVFSFKYFSFPRNWPVLLQECNIFSYLTKNSKYTHFDALFYCCSESPFKGEILAFVEYFIGICQQFHICLLFYVVENRLLPLFALAAYKRAVCNC